MLIEIKNNLIDLTLVGHISNIYTHAHFNRKAFYIKCLNNNSDIIIISEEYDDTNKDEIISNFETLRSKLVTFWKIAKKQNVIIKLD